MRKQSKSGLSELGSLMIEAMAMLALISMVTPILYKKAAERTTELQDINAASQMRSLIKSLDDYVSDHYDDIIQGKKVSQNCPTASVDFNDMKATTGASTQKKTINIDHFCEYLPYGFLDKDKKAQETKTFSKNYKVVLKKVDGGSGRKRVITAFLATDPKEGDTFPKLRAARIASMIGSNGGFINVNGDKASAMGTQGIWGVDNLNTDLGIATNTVKDGAVIASSVQGIAAQGGVDNENVLYRKYRSNRELNTMETDLLMGANAAQGQNIINVNQMIIEAGNAGNFKEGTNAANNALYIKNGGMTVKGGITAADTKFSVDTGGKVTAVEYVAGNFNAKDGALNLGGAFQASNSGLTMTYSGGSWSATSGVSDAPVNINANTKITGNLHVTGNEYLGGDLRVGGTIDANKLHARTQLSAGGEANAPTNAVITGTSSVFKQPTFRIGGSGANDARLSTTATNTILRGGAGGLLLDSSQNVTMKSSQAGKVTISAGTGTLDLDSGSNVTIDSATTGNIALNGTMMKLYPSTATITSVVNSFLTGNTQAAATNGLSAFAAAYSITDVQNRRFKTKKMNFEVADGSNSNVFTIDPGDTGISGRAAKDKAYATMRGKLTVTNNPSGGTTTNVFQVTPSNQTENTAAVNVSNDYLRVNNLTDASKVMTVDIKGTQKADTAANKGPVYVRKGVVELAANTGSTARALSEHQGYVKADRFVANHALEAKALSKPTDLGKTLTQLQGEHPYDHYQVNPAYTSVMHDIKLTTRGGARLSDILPDFINKGIYIVDNTYKFDEVSSSWSDVYPKGHALEGHHRSFNPTTAKPADCGSEHSCEVSPWAGFVPAPQCPPGYMKVITLTPATFSMAQAGIPGPLSSGVKPDLIIDYNVRDPNEYVDGATGGSYKGKFPSAPTPLYFQKNTWLRSMVIPYNAGTNSSTFRGWSTVMGFIYPYSYYKKYIELLKANNVTEMPSTGDNKTIIWNLFPVWNQTLEGYATVYCYFNREEATWDATLVDKTYDQLGAFRNVYSKSNSSYESRLNDPTLGYTDPW